MGHSTIPTTEWFALGRLVDEVSTNRAAIAALQAREARLLASGADLIAQRIEDRRRAGLRSHSDLPLREVSAELGAALRVSDRAIQGRIGDAATLVNRFSVTLAAWERGEVDQGHVAAILDAGAGIGDDGLRARFEERALAVAEDESANRLRSIARTLAAHIDPEGVDERMLEGRSRRRVRIADLGDGMARLSADLPATLAYAIEDRLTQLARAVHGSSSPACSSEAVEAIYDAPPISDHTIDDRTMDQLRADILCDVLLAGAPVAHGDGLSAITAHVQITVPALTLAGRDDGPALLAGAGPIDLETARRLAAGAPGWDRVLTDPFTGAVLAVDRYRPSASIVRFLAARDEHCRFPGCRRAAHRCDIDHTVDAALGGATAEDNLAHFCRRHHTLKHETAWNVRQLGGGVLEWTSPTGRRYDDRPPSTVRFVPSSRLSVDDDPPPF